MFEGIDFTPGKITFNDFLIDENTLLDEDSDELKEDMLQVVYPKDYRLDIGWYSSIKSFIVFVIKEYDWEKPKVKIICKNLKEVEQGVLESIKIIKEQII